MNGRYFDAFWALKHPLATGFNAGQAVHLGKVMKKG